MIKITAQIKPDPEEEGAVKGYCKDLGIEVSALDEADALEKLDRLVADAAAEKYQGQQVVRLSVNARVVYGLPERVNKKLDDFGKE